MDCVFIEGLNVETIIGVYEHEKLTPQTLLFDVDMAFDNSVPAKSDSIDEALDYHKVSLRIIELSKTQYDLVESLAEVVASTIIEEFGVQGIRLKVSKPEALEYTKTVGVKISRGIQF